MGQVNKSITDTPVLMFSKQTCGYCYMLKNLLNSLKYRYGVVEMDKLKGGGQCISSALVSTTKMNTVPQFFIGGELVGGCQEAIQLHKKGVLKQMIEDAYKAVDEDPYRSEK